jgi:hypothetical protein
MSFKDQIALDVAQVFLNPSEFADMILYNGKSIPANIMLGHDRDKGNTFTETGQAARACFWVSAADVSEPAACDTIQVQEVAFLSPFFPVNIKDVKWQVSRVLVTEGGMHKIEATTSESALQMRW